MGLAAAVDSRLTLPLTVKLYSIKARKDRNII